jgi:sec-independent protein translocase protein TatB
MFGLGFGELCVIIVVALVVIGPRDLPKVMRKAGQWAGKLRRMAADARAQSGIDDILQDTSITDDLQEIRKLARGELDGVAKAVSGAVSIKEMAPSPSANSLVPYSADASHSSSTSRYRDDPYESSDVAAAREREYPRDGADSYRALPDTALAYSDGLPSSYFADDPLYTDGDITAPPRKIVTPPKLPQNELFHEGELPGDHVTTADITHEVKTDEVIPDEEPKPEAAP